MFNGTPLIPLLMKRQNPESPQLVDMTVDSPRSMTSISTGSISLSSFDPTSRKRHAATHERNDVELGIISELEANP